MAGRKFAYPYQIKRTSDDLSSLLRALTENFGAIQRHMNGYLISREVDTDLVSITDLVVTDITLGGAITHGTAPQAIHAYANAADNPAATTWTPISIDTQVGSSTILTLDAINNEIDFSASGIYLVQAQVEFNAAESGYIRLLQGGVEAARASFDNRLTAAICAPLSAAAAGNFKVEVYTDTASTTVAGSTSTYIKSVRLFGA